MLVLTRKTQESIWIGDSIRLVIVEIRKRGGESAVVRIGIDAPSDVSIQRNEVRERIIASDPVDQDQRRQAVLERCGSARSFADRCAVVRKGIAIGVPLHKMEQIFDQMDGATL